MAEAPKKGETRVVAMTVRDALAVMKPGSLQPQMLDAFLLAPGRTVVQVPRQYGRTTCLAMLAAALMASEEKVSIVLVAKSNMEARFVMGQIKHAYSLTKCTLRVTIDDPLTFRAGNNTCYARAPIHPSEIKELLDKADVCLVDNIDRQTPAFLAPLAASRGRFGMIGTALELSGPHLSVLSEHHIRVCDLSVSV